MSHPSFSIRPAVLCDIPAIAGIEAACFSDPWSEKALTETMENPIAALLCAKSGDGITAGYVGVYFMGEDADITNVAVLPAHRRKGLADSLITALEALCRERGVLRLHLEVRASNVPAIALYEKHGFFRDGLRRNYYRNPREDAVLMTLQIS